MRATIRDVAKHAGVSTATVSHVLNKTRNVSEETCTRVRQSVEELGYVPDPTAQMLRTGKKHLIGFIVPDISNIFFAIIIDAIEEVLSQKGYKLLLVNSKEDPERELDNISALASGICDGMIVASGVSDWHKIARAIPRNYPLILLDRALEGAPWETLLTSNYNSVYAGVENLIMQGHTRIGYIAGFRPLSTTRERLKAYTDCMESHNLPMEDVFVQYGNSMSSSVYRPLDALLDAKCTAVVVSNNIMATDALYYLAQKGLRVGDDIDMLGYSEQGRRDYNLHRMSLINQPCAEMGHIAGQRILAHVENPDIPIQNTLLYSTYTPHISKKAWR